MSTASLRKDHDLIETVVKSMQTTVGLLQEEKIIPESILMPVIDFSNFFFFIWMSVIISKKKSLFFLL